MKAFQGDDRKLSDSLKTTQYVKKFIELIRKEMVLHDDVVLLVREILDNNRVERNVKIKIGQAYDQRIFYNS